MKFRVFPIALVTLALSLFNQNLQAQSPQGVKYQAVVRNATGEVIASSSVGMRLSVLQGSSSGTAVYSETHTPTTNTFGLVNLTLGAGSTSNSFSTIDWADGPYYVKIEIDAAGGTNYINMGTSQLLSVPYALMAKSVEQDEVNDADSDSTNELITSFALVGNDLSVTDAGGTNTVDLSSVAGDADADPTNELITSASLNGNDLEIVDAGGTNTVDLSSIAEDSDADPANELITSAALSGTNLQITDAGGTNTVSLSALVDDADADATNELITNAALSGTNLQITDAGGTNTVNLSALVNDADANPNNELQTLSYSNNQLNLSQNGGSISFPYDSSYWQKADDTLFVEDHQVAIGTTIGSGILHVYNDGTITNTSIVCESETSGLNRGLLGYARSTASNTAEQFGVVGIARNQVGSTTSGSGIHVGVSGGAYATDASSFGVEGQVDGQGDDNFAVRGSSGADATIRNYGGYFDTEGTSTDWNIGVLTVADGAHTGTNYGLYSIASGASTNYAAYFSGNVAYTGSLTSASDRKLKSEIVPFDGALDMVNSVGIYSYFYKADEFKNMNLPREKQIGFVAQDLEKVIPELVSEQKAPTEGAADEGSFDGEAFTTYKGVNYTAMIPILTQAIKEQQILIELQQKRIEEIEAQLLSKD